MRKTKALIFSGVLLIVTALVSVACGKAKTKTLRFCENTVATTYISPYGTVVEFPVKPDKVALGWDGAFNLEFIANDVVLTPKTSASVSHLFVYMHGRRYTFNLVTSATYGKTVYKAKDCQDETSEVNIEKIDYGKWDI